MWGVKRISVNSLSGMYVTELFPGVYVKKTRTYSVFYVSKFGGHAKSKSGNIFGFTISHGNK
jgi:hypothetical protein